MDTRKQTILSHAIQQYIDTAEPVGSKVLAETSPLGLSSATIRHELNELEQDGYLTQPHTSSGRVPTDKGYRHYVNAVASGGAITNEQQNVVQTQLVSVGRNVNAVLSQISEVMSSLIDYTTIVLTPDIYQETLKVVHLILVDLDRVLVVLLNASGINSEFLLTLKDRIDQETLDRLSYVMTQKLRGKSIYTFDKDSVTDLIAELPILTPLLTELSEALFDLKLGHRRHQSLMTKGVGKLLKLPEFRNVELTQKVLVTLEENKALSAVLAEYLESSQCQVVIGQENRVETLQECSLVVAPILATQGGVESSAVMGVLGPRRMSYATIVPMVQKITEMVSHHLNQTEAGYKERKSA